jgi:hypothetical protein
VSVASEDDERADVDAEQQGGDERGYRSVSLGHDAVGAAGAGHV